VAVAVSAESEVETKFAADETFSLPKGNETIRVSTRFCTMSTPERVKICCTSDVLTM